MRYIIEIETDDPTQVVVAIGQCAGVKLERLVNLDQPAAEEPKKAPRRPIIGRNPSVRTPDDLKGQAREMYLKLADGKKYWPNDLIPWFHLLYPHVSQPQGSIASILRTLVLRGFIKKSPDGYFRPDVQD